MIDAVKQTLENHSSKLEFEAEGHTYSHQGVNMIPVTSMVGLFHEEFDTERVSQEYVERRGLGESERQEVLGQWAESGRIAREQGTRVHAYAEDVFHKTNAPPKDGFERAVLKFWRELPKTILPVSSELRVFSEYYNYAGTLDNIFFDTKKNGLIITDYKTNKDIHKNFKGKKMLPPFEGLFDTPYNHYQVQLSAYQIPIEQVTGVKVIRRLVVWLSPNGTYELIATNDYTDRIRKFINF